MTLFLNSSDNRHTKTIKVPDDAEDFKIERDWRLIVSWTVPSTVPTHTRVRQSETFTDLNIKAAYALIHPLATIAPVP